MQVKKVFGSVKRVVVGAGVAALGAVSMSAHAAMDTTAVTTALTDAGTAAATVGGAALSVYVGIKAYHMIRRAL